MRVYKIKILKKHQSEDAITKKTYYMHLNLFITNRKACSLYSITYCKRKYCIPLLVVYWTIHHVYTHMHKQQCGFQHFKLTPNDLMPRSKLKERWVHRRKWKPIAHNLNCNNKPFSASSCHKKTTLFWHRINFLRVKNWCPIIHQRSWDSISKKRKVLLNLLRLSLFGKTLLSREEKSTRKKTILLIKWTITTIAGTQKDTFKCHKNRFIRAQLRKTPYLNWSFVSFLAVQLQFKFYVWKFMRDSNRSLHTNKGRNHRATMNWTNDRNMYICSLKCIHKISKHFCIKVKIETEWNFL